MNNNNECNLLIANTGLPHSHLRAYMNPEKVEQIFIISTVSENQ